MLEFKLRNLQMAVETAANELRTEILVGAKVNLLVEPDTITKTEGKAVRVIDNRED